MLYTLLLKREMKRGTVVMVKEVRKNDTRSKGKESKEEWVKSSSGALKSRGP